jgi:hypothetical protein
LPRVSFRVKLTYGDAIHRMFVLKIITNLYEGTACAMRGKSLTEIIGGKTEWPVSMNA